MAWNINDPSVHEMVQEIARISGESQEQAVATAVQQRLAHLQEGEVATRLLAIGRRTAARMSPEAKRLDHGTLLYDDRASDE